MPGTGGQERRKRNVRYNKLKEHGNEEYLAVDIGQLHARQDRGVVDIEVVKISKKYVICLYYSE